MVPVSFFTATVDTTIGVGASIGSFCTLGLHAPTNRFAISFIGESEKLLYLPYKNFLKMINPDAQIKSVEYDLYEEAPFWLKDVIINCKTSKSPLIQHIAIRLICPLIAVSVLAMRIKIAILAIPSVIFSVLTLGANPAFNNDASRFFELSSIITDLFLCTLFSINLNPERW